MRKKIFVTGLAIIMSVMASITVFADWYQQDGRWKYEKDSKFEWSEKGRTKIDGKLYQFDRDGYMVTGWYQDEHGKWAYYGPDGSSVRQAWIDDTYFVGFDGVMWADRYTPDGYYVGSDGRYVPGMTSEPWETFRDGSYEISKVYTDGRETTAAQANVSTEVTTGALANQSSAVTKNESEAQTAYDKYMAMSEAEQQECKQRIIKKCFEQAQDQLKYPATSRLIETDLNKVDFSRNGEFLVEIWIEAKNDYGIFVDVKATGMGTYHFTNDYLVPSFKFVVARQ